MYFLQRKCPVCLTECYGVCDNCISGFRAASYGSLIKGVSSHRAVYYYDSKLGKAILSFKHSGRVDVLKQLANLLADFVYSSVKFYNVDVLTWVPASRSEKKSRGFDQGKVLAKAVSKKTSIPARALLSRVSDDRQLGKNKFDRLLGPSLIAPFPVSKRILLLDDVVTTGASIQSSAAELGRQGAAEVIAFSLAMVR